MTAPILPTWTGQWPDIKATPALNLDEGVLDQAAFNAIEVDKLFDSVNHASTTIGQAVLYRSLTQPSADLDFVHSKQAAVKELQQNAELKKQLSHVVQHAAADENNFYLLLFGEFLGSSGTARESYQIEGFGYLQYKRGVRFVLELIEKIQTIPSPESPYLAGLLQRINAFSKSRDYSMMQGPVYVSEQGLKSKEERQGVFTPAFIFKPRLFKPLLISLVIFGFWALAKVFANSMFTISASIIPTLSIFLVPMSLVYIPIIGGFDRDNVIIPLRKQFRASPEVADMLDALGQIDELLSFFGYAEAYESDMVLPELVSTSKHQLNLQAVKNPVLGKANPAYVPNSLSLEKERLLLITGPNSGGKTAFCKTVTQVQLLAQIGCFIPASAATLSVADKILYQVPEISQMADGEGRFGTELKRTKEIFVHSSAKSLVVLDELSEGTTFEEKMESSTNVLQGFYRKGNNTILITHNHQLVDHFMAEKIGVAMQVEFADEQPSYRLIPGISRVSHADRVAKKIGFSKQDIDNYLAQEQ